MDLSLSGLGLTRTPNGVDRLANEVDQPYTNGYVPPVRFARPPAYTGEQTGRYPDQIGRNRLDTDSPFQRGGLGTLEKTRQNMSVAKTESFSARQIRTGWNLSETTIAEALQKEISTKSACTWGNGIWGMRPGVRKIRDIMKILAVVTSPHYPFSIPTITSSIHPTIRAGIHKLPGRKPGEYLTHREADEAVKLIRNGKTSLSSSRCPITRCILQSRRFRKWQTNTNGRKACRKLTVNMPQW